MGLTSRAGVFPLNLRADIAGPMARTVEDAVKVFQVIVGEDPRRPGDRRRQGPRHSRLQRSRSIAMASKAPSSACCTRRTSGSTTDPEIVRIFMAALEDMRRAGATVVDPAKVEGLDGMRRPQGSGPCMGFKYDLNHFLADRAGASAGGGSRPRS